MGNYTFVYTQRSISIPKGELKEPTWGVFHLGNSGIVLKTIPKVQKATPRSRKSRIQTNQTAKDRHNKYLKKEAASTLVDFATCWFRRRLAPKSNSPKSHNRCSQPN